MKKRMWRKVIAGLLVAACLLPMGAPALAAGETGESSSVDLTDGLAGYWTFDGESPLTNQATGSSITAATSGEGVAAAAKGGLHGGSVHFTGAANSPLTLADADNEGQGIFNASQDDLTLAVWVNYDSSMGTNDYKYLFQQADPGKSILFLENNNNVYKTYIAGSNGTMSAIAVDRGEWHHVVVTWTASSKTLTCYINGKRQNSESFTTSPESQATDILVGAHKGGLAKNAIVGDVDELRYYTRALSDEEALALYQYNNYHRVASGESALYDGLEGYWTFDGDDAATRLTNQAEDSAITAATSGNGVVTKADGGIHEGSVYFSGEASSPLKLNLTAVDQGFNASSDDITLAAWVNYDKDMYTGDHSYLFQQDKPGKSILYVLANSGNYNTFIAGKAGELSTTAPTFGRWHHVVVTWEASTKTMTLYLNGQKAGNMSFTDGAPETSVTDILVGAHKDGAKNQAVKGYVDELRYYSRALSASEALVLYRYNDYNEVAEAAVDVTIAVNPETEVRDITPAMFGINHRYHKNGYGTWDAEAAKVNDAFSALVEDAGFGSIRWPGGTVSNLFTWKDSIGPLEERTPTIAGNNFYSDEGEVPVEPGFGLDEAAEWIVDDLGVEMVYVYGMGRGNAQDAADLVEYLNAPATEEYPWAMKRAENGHEEPYNVTKFEIGNEFGDTGQNYWAAPGSVDDYTEGGIKTYTGVQQYYQVNDRVVKKGDWRKAASFSDGQPGEVRYVCYTPVLQDNDHPVTIKVNGTQWTIVDSLENQAADAQVCTFDYEEGKITFGDGTHGKIPPQGQQITANYSSDRDGFVDYYDAMKAVAAKIGIEIKVYSGVHHSKHSAFITKMNALGKEYDGVVYHPYTGGGVTYTEANYNDALTLARNKAVEIESKKTQMGEGKDVAVSEFGVNMSSEFTKSLGNAIYTANLMIDSVNAGAAYLNRHCLVDFAPVNGNGSDNLGSWEQSVIQCHGTAGGAGGDNVYISTPSARLFSLFNYMTGSVQVGYTAEDNDNYHTSNNQTVQKLNIYTTKDEYGNVYALVVNNQLSAAQKVQISVADEDLTGRKIDVWYLTSDSIMDQNTVADPDKVAVQKTQVTADGETLTYTLAAHSITSFKISGAVVLPEPDTGIASITVGETTTTTQPWNDEPWTLELPEGSELPAPEDITVVTADAAATAVVTRGDTDGMYIITVTAADGTTSKEYTLKVTIKNHDHEWGTVNIYWHDQPEWISKGIGYYVENLDAVSGATRVCVAEAEGENQTKQTAEMEVTVVSRKDPTCTESGTLVVSAVATFEGDNESYSAGEHTFTFPAAGHTLHQVAEVPATTTSTGVKEHWKCEVCGKLFLDANGANETTLDAVTIPKLSDGGNTGGGTGGNTGGGNTGGGGTTGGGGGGAGGGGTTPPATGDTTTTNAKKVTSPEGDVTITVTDESGEVIAKVELPATIPAPAEGFIDLDPTPWAEEAINSMAGLGLVNGVGNSKYDPTASMTRGSLATVLFRLSQGKTNYAVNFKDVTQGQFYTDGVAWAAKVGVVTGYSADTFAPNDTITREQLAVMLARYAKLIGMDTTADAASLNTFTDKSSTGAWAAEGVAWCVDKGILQGKGANNLDPTAKVTRAEVAVMLDRFIALVR